MKSFTNFENQNIKNKVLYFAILLKDKSIKVHEFVSQESYEEILSQNNIINVCLPFHAKSDLEAEIKSEQYFFNPIAKFS